MFCENCGQKLGENSLFCSKCGTKVRDVAPSNPVGVNSNAPVGNAAADVNATNINTNANATNPVNSTNVATGASPTNPVNAANPTNTTNATNSTNTAPAEKTSDESFSWTDLFKEIPGRYNRSEYWWRALGYVLVFMVGFSLIADMTDREIERELGTIGYYVVLFILLGVLWGFARCAVKRFHDANYSGYYLGGYYLAVKLITKLFDIDSIDTWVFVYVLIPYFIALILPTHQAPNEWGDPK